MENRMSLSWVANRSMQVSPRARLVDDSEADALRRKLEAIEWKPQNGFLKDQMLDKDDLVSVRTARAACRNPTTSAAPGQRSGRLFISRRPRRPPSSHSASR